MDFVTAVILPVVAVFVGFIGLQVFLTRRMLRLRGQDAPPVDGAAGARVQQGETALFYFFSPACGACRSMTPVVKALASEAPGVFPVDVSQDMDTARRFSVMATPTTILVRDGKVQEVLVGPQSPARLRGLVGA